MKPQKIAKYRPVLTSHQIVFLIELCKNSHTVEAKSCIASLAMYEYKISMGVVGSLPQSENPRIDLETSLGFSPDDPTNRADSYQTDAKGLYLVYINSGKIGLNLTQCEILDEYRYTNDLMSEEESIEYENSLLQNAKNA